MSVSRFLRARAIAVAMIAVPAAMPAVASAEPDAVVRICTEQMPDADCNCAAERLEAEIGAADYAAYGEVVAVFLDGLARGEEMAPAWDAALAETGRDLQQTNPWGRAHRAAIDACGA